MTLLMTVLRGLRSRALLSAGSVLLTALAIGSAVLGPMFSVAVTNSFLITRLDEAPNPLTGLSWRFSPDSSVEGDPVLAARAAESAAEYAEGSFAPPQSTLLTRDLPALGGAQVNLLANPDLARVDLGGLPGCAHLDVTGVCPDVPFEVLLLAGDSELTGLRAGDTFEVAGRTLTITGTYRAPGPEEADFWFDPGRFVSIPPHETRAGTTPYQPAPFVTVPETFAQLDQSDWLVLVDRRFAVPPGLTLADLELAERTAQTLEEPPRAVTGGLLAGSSINDIDAITREARAQQDTARNSIAPAVLSLVLVALALLLRLLMAAADLRLPELALAALRGLSRRQLWQLGLSEPLVLLAISVPVGGAVGIGLARSLVRAWLVPGLPLPLPWTSVLTGVVVVVATVGVAVLAVGLVLRVALSEQLTGVRRPRRPTRISTVLQLVLVAAALAVLASKLSAGAPGDPDVTDLVLPVLLAVVAGLAATRLTAGVATWWTRRRRTTRSLPAFVAARAISRRQEGTLVVLPVTAAIAICVFGAGVYDSAAQWRASVAATVAPAAEVWRSPMPLASTVALTHQLDPDGQYLMAATTIVTQGPAFSVLDTERLSRVAAWQQQWTPGVGPEQIADELGLDATVPRVTGGVVGVTVDRNTKPGDPLFVRLRLNSADGAVHFAFLGPFGHGQASAEEPVPYCLRGCELEAITLGGPATAPLTIDGTVRLSGVTADGVAVAGAIDGAGWSVAPEASAGDAITGVVTDGDELVVSLDAPDEPIIVQLAAGALPAALPVVKGVDAVTEARPGTTSTSAMDFPVHSVVEARSVPLLGPVGLMIDAATLTTNRTIYEQDTPVLVLARADTPSEMTQGLQDQGATLFTTLNAERRTLDQSAYALALRLYAVVAALVLLMALAGLFISTAVQLPARRHDAASLRVVGVRRGSVMSSVLRELVFVLGSTAVAGLAAGSLAQYVVLRTVTLGYVERLTTPALVAAIDPARLAVLALLAVLLFGGIALASSVLTVRGARGATLRENAR